jgi:hypothetical protein
VTPVTLASAIVAWLEKVGARLEVGGHRLVVDAPQGILTDDDFAFLSERKAELLAHLAAKPQPPFWRAELARWAERGEHDRRERWGRRANDLEARGTPWREAEQLAFEEVAEMQTALPGAINTEPAGCSAVTQQELCP